MKTSPAVGKSRLFKPAWFSRILILLVAATLTHVAHASPPLTFLHPLFTSNMVLPRDVADPVWGWTAPGAQVLVSINGHNYTATADPGGRWQVNVGPFPAGGPYTMTVTGPQSATLTNIMMGDVWLCSGQSNMAYTLQNMSGVPVLNCDAEVADSVNYPNVRVFTTPAAASASPQLTIAASAWQVPGSTTTPNFSATGYFMARELSKRLSGAVPVGIVVSAVGGSNIYRWLSPEVVSGFPDFANTTTADQMSTYYNGMVAPLVPFPFKGVCWYQGETNAPVANGGPQQYTRLLPLFMNGWRSHFSRPFPFVIVQLCTEGGNGMDTTNWGDLRFAQTKGVLADTNSVIVNTLDLGNANLHPVNKQDVGYRAARAAGVLAYGQSAIAEGPIFDHAVVQGSSIRCYFTSVAGGLMVGFKDAAVPLAPVQPSSVGLTGFYVAGTDGSFKAATATIDSATNTVVASASTVPAPAFVRYAWGGNPPNNLYNKILGPGGVVQDGMPSGSFQSDPAYQLSVNPGLGSAASGSVAYTSVPYTVPVTSATISAGTPPVGQVFDRWTGDTGILANLLGATTTATLPPEYSTVAAHFRSASGSVLYPPWNSQDIGAVGQPGETSMNMAASTFTLKAAGSDIGPSPDAFHFAYITLKGDGVITAKVDSQGATGNNPKAGVMMRASLNADAAYTFAYVTPTECRYQGRYANGNLATSGSVGTRKWIRIVRSGGSFTAYSSADGASWSQLGTTVVLGLTGPMQVGLAGCSRNVSVTNTAVLTNVTVTYSPWTSLDIGSTGLPGSSSLYAADGSIAVTGAGGDIGASPDAFQFCYFPLNGDGTITARVASQETSGNGALAGIMMRASLAADSPYAFACVNSTQCRYQARSTAGGGVATSGSPGAYKWIRVVRTGSQFRGYYSTDGATWTQLGSTVTLSTTGPIYVGLASCSRSVSATNTALFSNVAVTYAPWLSQDIGAVGVAGGATLYTANNSFAVTGAGSDIGISPDSFQFCYLPLTGDGTITAQVTSQQASGDNPKAGVMMRTSLSADSAYAFSYVTPTECRYQGRTTAGGGVGTSSTPGVFKWIRAVRTGSQFRGYYSADGVSWTQLGSTVTIPGIAGPIYVGMAVCSRNPAVTHTAGFSNVTAP